MESLGSRNKFEWLFNSTRSLFSELLQKKDEEFDLFFSQIWNWSLHKLTNHIPLSVILEGKKIVVFFRSRQTSVYI